MKSTQGTTLRRDNANNKAHINRYGDAEWRRREEFCKQAWFKYIATHDTPDDIPARPDLVYANEGWRGWKDWIGLTDSKGKGGLP